jgi:transcription initiation factor TFIIIB Brf1 subunit/transcription initiation factor TFIIB
MGSLSAEIDGIDGMDDMFMDMDEFADILKELNDDTVQDSYKKCDECGVDMLPELNNTLTCTQCGLVIDCFTDNINYEPSMDGYNTSDKFHIPIKCVGKNSFQYQKQLRNSTSQYSLVQESNLRKKLDKLNFKSPELKIPKNILTNTINQYRLIRQTNKINRGSVLDGIIGSLVYYECLKEGIIRKPKEISEWMCICENDLSKGDKILRYMEVSGVIEIPTNEDNEDKYIESYLKRMCMDKSHKALILEVFYRLEEWRIGNPNSRLSTKIAALIFMVALVYNLEVEADDISKEFNIAISTFKSFYNDMVKRKKYIEDILVKYKVELPAKLPRKKRKTEPAAEAK